MEKLKITIGRSSQCDYIIENPDQYGTVSGNHATISETDTPNTFLFEDHSTNGTYINGQLVHNDTRTVNVGDHITLGKTYILPFDDIVKRYFSTKTTKKKPQFPQGNGTTPVPSPEGETIPQPSNGNTNENSVVPEAKIIKEIPMWYWILYAGSIIVAFVLGILCA